MLFERPIMEPPEVGIPVKPVLVAGTLGCVDPPQDRKPVGVGGWWGCCDEGVEEVLIRDAEVEDGVGVELALPTDWYRLKEEEPEVAAETWGWGWGWDWDRAKPFEVPFWWAGSPTCSVSTLIMGGSSREFFAERALLAGGGEGSDSADVSASVVVVVLLFSNRFFIDDGFGGGRGGTPAWEKESEDSLESKLSSDDGGWYDAGEAGMDPGAVVERVRPTGRGARGISEGSHWMPFEASSWANFSLVLSKSSRAATSSLTTCSLYRSNSFRSSNPETTELASS